MHHLRLRTAVAVLCTVGLLFAGAATAAAETGTGPDPVDDTINPGDRDAGETIDDIDLPDGWVETVPDGLNPQPDPEPDSGIAFTVGKGTDGHYCGSHYINHISYTFNYRGDDYTRLHIEVTRWYLYLGRLTLVLASQAWNAALNCMRTGGPHGVYVRSWAAMKDQFLCHAAGAALGPIAAREVGTSWDLEGHRYPTNNPYTWATTRCNW